LKKNIILTTLLNFRKTVHFNILNAIQVALGLTFQVLLARFYGASQYTDIYFVSISIISFISAFVYFYLDLFIQYYNDIKVNDHREAIKLYHSLYNISVITGLIIFIASNIFSNYVFEIYVPGFDKYSLTLLNSYFQIVSIGFVITGITKLNDTLLNAEMHFFLPYLLGILYPAFNIISLLLFSDKYGIIVIAYSILLSQIITILIQQYYIARRLKIGISLILRHKDIKSIFKVSASMRVGNQIWILNNPITTNILSHYPAGMISLYSYASRIISIIFEITNSPILKIYYSKASYSIARADFSSLKGLIKETLLQNTVLFILAIVPFTIVLPDILKIIFGNKFTASDIQMIYRLFILLIPLYLILTIETLYSYIIILMKNSVKIIQINAVYIVLYAALLFILNINIGIYSIPIALITAQIYNCVSYLVNVRKVMQVNVLHV
jgi:putative peptidoglycan lipid II flippase